MPVGLAVRGAGVAFGDLSREVVAHGLWAEREGG